MGMIFQYTLDQILCAQKTQTRRVIRTGETAVRGRYNRIEAVLHNDRVKWRVGQTYAVQPARGAAQVARIALVQINSEHIMRISTADATAEGFSSRLGFLATWQRIHGLDSMDCRVWVLKFELVDVFEVWKPAPQSVLAYAD